MGHPDLAIRTQLPSVDDPVAFLTVYSAGLRVSFRGLVSAPRFAYGRLAHVGMWETERESEVDASDLVLVEVVREAVDSVSCPGHGV